MTTKRCGRRWIAEIVFSSIKRVGEDPFQGNLKHRK